MARSAATFTATALGVAAARTAIKMGNTIAINVGADLRELEALQSRFINTRFGSIKLHVRKCIERVACASMGIWVAKKTGSPMSVKTQALFYGAAVGSSMLLGR